MTVELDRDDLVNLIIGCSSPYYTIMDKYNEKGLNLGHYVGGFVDLDNLILLYTNDIRKKVIDSYIEDGEDEEMAQFIVDYFEYIYGKRGEEE